MLEIELINLTPERGHNMKLMAVATITSCPSPRTMSSMPQNVGTSQVSLTTAVTQTALRRRHGVTVCSMGVNTVCTHMRIRTKPE